ncbi:MAG: AbrB/MazE/SpoVT family DNA-binding domain-containing protein [Oscillospiraceae bacterium]|nr:AbrB/MazE/SpoVT family DNA-binding domain-containing protein [Oscillospiraceae bacterium]
MTTNIKKWGNSQGIRLPKQLLDAVKFSDNDTVEIFVENDGLVIKKVTKPTAQKTLRELLDGFEGEYIAEEWDMGSPVGKEVW